MSVRHERFYRNVEGDWVSEVIGEDTRDLATARRERMALVWHRARLYLADRLEQRGYDPDSASALAATLLFQRLPQQERTAVGSIADTVASALNGRLAAIASASTNEEVDQVNP